MQTRLLSIVFILIILMASQKAGFSQDVVQGHSTDLVDAKALFRNPALVSFHRAKFFAGAKAYYLGLGGSSGVPLRQGFFAASTPFLINDLVGIGAGGQYFTSPVYRESRFGLRVSGRFDFVSVGLEIDALTVGYNRSNFTEDALNDPLFADGTSKTVLALGLGTYVQPYPGLGLSLGARNLNQPNIALGEAVTRERVEFYTGVSYAYGPLRATFEFNRREVIGSTALLSVEVYSTQGHFARATSDFNFDQTRIEAQYHVGGPLSVNYSYDLPTNELLGPTTGSHQFTLIYEFGRSPSVGTVPVLPPNHIPFGLADQEADLIPMIYVTTEVDFVEVFEKRVRRRYEAGLPANAFASLSKADIDVADSTFAAYELPYDVEPVSTVPEDVRFPTPISPAYEASLSRIGDQLANQSVEELSIVGRNDLVEKALGLRNRVVFEEGAPGERVAVGTPRFDSVQDSLLFHTALVEQDIVPEEVFEYAAPGHTQFHLYPFQINLSDLVGWSLSIYDQNNNEVRVFSGGSSLPENIFWDWKTSMGELIEPGVYYYQLTWQEGVEGMKQSSRSRIYVKKYVRQITIDIRQNLDALDASPDKVQLLIKN